MSILQGLAFILASQEKTTMLESSSWWNLFFIISTEQNAEAHWEGQLKEACLSASPPAMAL